MCAVSSYVTADWSTFDPWRIQTVTHTLGEHPLMQIDQLIELGRRLDSSGQTFSFSSKAGADADFNTVARTHPNRNSTYDTLLRIKQAEAWMLLRHVQSDPLYRTLVDSILDGIKPYVDRKDPGMCYRAGWIFVSSPNSVTPFHIDRNHVLLLQVLGTKRVYVWDCDDTNVLPDRARARFLSTHNLDLVKWREEYRERAHVFDLGPGTGVYMPLTSPHMVEIGDEPSVAISVSYNTDASRRRALLHALRERTRGTFELPAVDRYPLFDSLSLAGARAMMAARDAGRRLLGRESPSDGMPYAVAD